MKIVIYGILFLACCTVCCTGKATGGKEGVEKKDSSPEEDSIRVKKVHPDSIGFPRFAIIDKYAPFLYKSLNTEEAIVLFGPPVTASIFSTLYINEEEIALTKHFPYSYFIKIKEQTWRTNKDSMISIWYSLKDTVNDVWEPVEYSRWDIGEEQFYRFYRGLDEEQKKRFASPEVDRILRYY